MWRHRNRNASIYGWHFSSRGCSKDQERNQTLKKNENAEKFEYVLKKVTIMVARTRKEEVDEG